MKQPTVKDLKQAIALLDDDAPIKIRIHSVDEAGHSFWIDRFPYVIGSNHTGEKSEAILIIEN